MCECRLCLGPPGCPGREQTVTAAQFEGSRSSLAGGSGPAVPLKFTRCELKNRSVSWLKLPDRLLRGVARLVIRLYQLLLSPLLGPGCRFEPSCSRYAQQALEQHHLVRALHLIVRRLLRCHPWGGQGWDPVPNRARELSIASESAHSFGKFSFEAAPMIPCGALRGGAASAVSEG